MAAKETILILQIGSLGDTVISLPCYREIARRHPYARRYLVTNFPAGSRWVPAEAILLPTGVIEGSIEYPMPLRQVGAMLTLWRRIRSLRPQVLYYLLPEKKLKNLVRHYAFLKACGVPLVRGMPWRLSQRYPREIVPGELWESEASRLLRTIGMQQGPPARADRDLVLSDDERARAMAVLSALDHMGPFVALSVGGKVPLNNWGDENWVRTLDELAARRPSLAVVFIGSADERPRNEQLAARWTGKGLNTCGELTPRETAALIERASAFVGHDTGTLHLAAAVDTPIVGVFSARNRPGKWFSDRPRDAFFYHNLACAGCELELVEDCPNGMACMTAHDPVSVAAAVVRALGD